jgi:hypothetical protein
MRGETLGALAMAGLAIWWLNRQPAEPARRDPAAGTFVHADAPGAAPDSTSMLHEERFSTEPEEDPEPAPEERAAPRAEAAAAAATAAAAKRPWTPPRLQPSTLGAFRLEPASPPLTVHTGEQDLTGQAAAPAPEHAPEPQRTAEAAARAEAPAAAFQATAATDPTCRLTGAPEAPLRYRQSVRFIQVSGDEDAVRRAIHSIPCSHPDSAACTNTRFEETCATRPSAGGCRSTCTVSLFVEFVYPRWDGRGSNAMKEKWARFKEAIEIHENSHKAIALGHANALARRLASISESECPRAGDIGVQALEDVRGVEEEEQARYDARACHAEF